MNNLQKLGFGYKKVDSVKRYSSETYLLHINALDSNLSRAFSEGIFGAARSTAYGVNRVGRGVRNAAQMGKEALRKLWDLIKRIMKGFIDMLKQMWIDIGNQQERMQAIAKKLEDTNKKLNSAQYQDASEQIQNGENYRMVTIKTLKAAGWSLELPKDMETAVNKMLTNLKKAKNNNPVANESMGDSVSVVAYFCKLITARADGASPEDALVGVKDFKSLYIALNVMFKEARNVYLNNPDFSAFAKWNNLTKLNGSNVVDNGDKLVYQYFNVNDYGKYVAQAFSPAGAFITTNDKESFNATKGRIEDIKKKLTPLQYDVPAANAHNEMDWATKYLAILFHYLVGLDIIDTLKKKAEKLNAILTSVRKLEMITVEDAKRYKNQANDAAKNSGELNDDEKNTNYEQSNPDESLKKGEAYNGLFLMDDILDELRSFGEGNDNSTVYGDNYSFSDDNKHASDAMNNLSDDGKYNNFINSKINGSNSNAGIRAADQTRSVFKDTVDIKESDVTAEGIAKGLKYLHSYLVAAGNLTFQEGRFYNIMTKLMCDTADELLETINDSYLSDKSDEDKQNDNSIHMDPVNPDEVLS